MSEEPHGSSTMLRPMISSRLASLAGRESRPRRSKDRGEHMLHSQARSVNGSQAAPPEEEGMCMCRCACADAHVQMRMCRCACAHLRCARACAEVHVHVHVLPSERPPARHQQAPSPARLQVSQQVTWFKQAPSPARLAPPFLKETVECHSSKSVSSK